jgi:hypothetical protein
LISSNFILQKLTHLLYYYVLAFSARVLLSRRSPIPKLSKNQWRLFHIAPSRIT